MKRIGLRDFNCLDHHKIEANMGHSAAEQGKGSENTKRSRAFEGFP